MTTLSRRPPFRRGDASSRPEVQERLRSFIGAKGLPDLSMDERVKAVIDVAQLEDPFYAREPQFWQLSASLAAAAGNTGKVGVQTPADSRVTSVDGFTVASDTNFVFSVIVVVGGQTLAAVTTDSSVFLRNRGAQDAGGQTQGTGLLRIADNGVFAGGGVGLVNGAGLASTTLGPYPLGYKLFGSEQLMVVINTVNVVARITLWGRVGRRSA